MNTPLHHIDGDPVDIKNITTRQMDLMVELFTREHNDLQQLRANVEKLFQSSNRLERFTFVLIGLTVVLALIGIWEVITKFMGV